MCQNAKRLDESCCLYSILTCFCPCVSLTLLRGKARAKYDIDGSCCEDALCSFLCAGCVNCQIANEIDSRD